MIPAKAKRRMFLSFCTMFFVALMYVTCAYAQEETTPAGNGTLTYTATVTHPTCTVDGREDSYTEVSFGDYSYSLNGTTTSLEPWIGDALDIWNPKWVSSTCPPVSETGNISSATMLIPGVGQELLFTPADLGGTGGIANVSALTYPAYYISSILYAPPGNKSNDGYTNSETYGTTSSIGANFQSGSSETISVSGGFMGIGSTLGFTYGTTSGSGTTDGFSTSMTQASGVSLFSVLTNPNTVSHSEDAFVIWLNPAVGILQTGTTSTGTYYLGSQLQPSGDPSPGQPEVVDAVEVSAAVMMANSSNAGMTTVPLSILEPQIVEQNGVQETLPGLANICAKPLPVAECTFANQCGCKPSDFTTVLAQDPLLALTTVQSPMSVNTDSVQTCTNPAATAQCRFVPIMEVVNGQPTNTQVSVALSGPDCSTCDPVQNSFTQSDMNQISETLNQSSSFNIATSWEVSFKPLGNGWANQNTTTWTWSYSESTGTTNSTAHSMLVNLQSGTIGCYDPGVTVYEDTIYHTFAFQQTPGNSSCP